MVLMMRKKKGRNHLLDPFSPNYEMFYCQCEPQTLSHQKPDVIFFLARLKGKNIFGLCFLHLNCVILDLGSILGFWGGLGFLALVFILGHPIPQALTTILTGSLRRPEEWRTWDSWRTQGSVEIPRELKDLLMRKNDSLKAAYIEGKI